MQGETSTQQFIEEVEKRFAKWKLGESRDGFVTVWRQRFRYRNLPYEIAMLRYYSFNNPFARINRIGKHTVLEHPRFLLPLAKIAELIKDVANTYEWLWRDTLHGWQMDWDEPTMIQQMPEEAKECIDSLYAAPIKILSSPLKSTIALFDSWKEQWKSKVLMKWIRQEYRRTGRVPSLSKVFR